MSSKSVPYLEISLDALTHNLRRIRERIPAGTGVIPVVKDCAYGCGAGPVARALQTEGIEFLAVARVREALALREEGITVTLLVLGDCTSDEALWAADNNVHLTINDLHSIEWLDALGCNARLHVNIDTGMGRLGLLSGEVETAAGLLAGNARLKVTGVFTHFASADVPDTDTVNNQLARFADAYNVLVRHEISPDCVHSANSAALLRFDVPTHHLVRPGIALYGCAPDPAQDFGIDLHQVATLKSCIVKVKTVPAGTPISYGGHYVTEATTRMATIALGYTHGYPRLLSNTGEVLIRGRRRRIAGNVTMDYIMVDTGPDSDVSVGDEVVAIGTQGNDTITADEIAKQANTIGYEILCGLSTGMDRYFLQNGAVVHRQHGLLF